VWVLSRVGVLGDVVVCVSVGVVADLGFDVPNFRS